MKKHYPNFIELCIMGNENIENIDDHIDFWHNGLGEGLSLSEYLGFTDKEYNIWLKHPNKLKNIIESRKNDK